MYLLQFYLRQLPFEVTLFYTRLWYSFPVCTQQFSVFIRLVYEAGACEFYFNTVCDLRLREKRFFVCNTNRVSQWVIIFAFWKLTTSKGITTFYVHVDIRNFHHRYTKFSRMCWLTNLSVFACVTYFWLSVG